MPTRRVPRSAALLAVPPILVWAATLGACASAAAQRSAARVAPADDVRRADAVLAEADVRTFTTLLAALSARVSSVRVAPGSDCPAVSLRPTRKPDERNAALIYVDGTPTVGTCALVQLSPFNIERIEVHATGGTGFARSQNGVILIFTKRG